MVWLSRLRRAGGSVLLAGAGVLALAASLPRLAFSGDLPACITESAGTAWLGLHLRLLAAHPGCPDGAYAPGPHYAEIAQFSVMLSLSALISGLAMLAAGLGFGLWARAALRSARDWLRSRLGCHRPTAGLTTANRSPLAVFIADVRVSQLVHLRLWRGPPMLTLA